MAATAQEAPKGEYAVAAGNNLYCAGYIQSSPVNTSMEVVGAEDEADQYVFAQGDNLVINAGQNKGINEGDKFSVIRPRGKFKSRWSDKKNLGFYVQEVGMIEIVKVKEKVSIARVKTSCSTMLLGDLLVPMPSREGLIYRERPVLDTFADSSGKISGRIVLARDGQEMVSRDQIVYIDLGEENNLQVGDYLTIYRPLGAGNLFDHAEKEALTVRERNFQSGKYRGSEFSHQAPRMSGSQAEGSIVTSEEAKSRRPKNLRRVIGEIVVLNVKEKTATAMVVRATQEIHTGDFVELQ